MTHGRYITIFLTCFTLVCISTAGINYLVDPYALFGSTRIQGFNEIKPRAQDRVRVVKPYQALRFQPNTIIGGNSRPEMGLDPESSCWLATEKPIYNLGTPGAGIYMQTRLLQQVMENKQVQQVFLGLDLLDFLHQQKGRTDYANWPEKPYEFESRLTHNPDGSSNKRHLIKWSSDMLTGLFSLDGLADSITTMATQAKANQPTRRENGFNPAQDYLDIISAEGQSVLFSHKNREVLRRLANPNLDVLNPDTKWSTSFEALRRFLRLAKQKNVRVTLFINPYHAEYLASIAITGKWHLLDRWKQELLRLTQNEGNIPLWDFNTLDEYSTEPPPSGENKSSILKWFWEPAHYRSELGELMLARMTGRKCGENYDSSFGVILDKTSIHTKLEKLRRDLGQYRKTHASSWRRLQQSLPRSNPTTMTH